ncbi:Unknown protein sequence [Pseudomonas meliae]|uniref:Uncharacterized protein n=1 Tax=Pseudomonas meliae TaxID=86176 RepID=A0A0P9WCZ2_9PSED|nr:Unknown protein sequence [Pseudomonas meliae]
MSQRHQILVGDCIDIMRTLPDESVHAPDERLCLEKGNGARGETLAGGKLSPRSPRLSVHQDSRLGAPSVVAGVTQEDRKALLGQKNGSITSLNRALNQGI